MALKYHLLFASALVLLRLATLQAVILFSEDIVKKWKHPVFITYLQISACIVQLPFTYFQEKWPTFQDVIHASLTALLYALATVTYIWSLEGMICCVNLCITQLSVPTTYLLSIAILGESHTALKNTSAFLTIGGALIIAILGGPPDDKATSTKPISVLLLLISTFISPFYYVLFKKFLSKDAGIVDTLAYAGLQGACAMVIFWPICLALHFAFPNYERITTPPEGLISTFAFIICAKPLLCSLALLPTALVSPLFLEITMAFILPISTIVDVFIHSFEPPLWFYLGMALILVGCTLHYLDENKKEDKEHCNEKAVSSEIETSKIVI